MISLLGQSGFPGPSVVHRGESGVIVLKAPCYPTKQRGICHLASTQTPSNWTTSFSKKGTYLFVGILCMKREKNDSYTAIKFDANYNMYIVMQLPECSMWYLSGTLILLLGLGVIALDQFS